MPAPRQDGERAEQRWDAGSILDPESARLSPVTHFTASDRQLLSRPLQAMITVAPAGGRWPAPRPVWFELTAADEIQLFSFASTPRVARVQETPRASIVVSAPVGEPEQWVSIEGSVTVHDDGAFELADRLARLYYAGEPGKLAVLDEWRDADLVRLVITPARVQRYSI